MSSITSLVPAKALKKAQAWAESKRGDIAASFSRHMTMQAGMWDDIQETMSELGINQVQIGNQVIDVTPSTPKGKSLLDEQHWTEYLNQGGWLAVLMIEKAGAFWGVEKVNPRDRKIEELVDVDLIAQLAPNSTLYGPTDKMPWPEKMGERGFQIWITDPQEYETLWAKLKQWVKTDWHDDTLRHEKYFHEAQGIFYVDLYYDIAPDLSWRIQREKAAVKKLDALEELHEFDPLTQQELKKALGSLMTIESHPLFGEDIQKTIEQLIPMLAHSMHGKDAIKKAEKERKDLMFQPWFKRHNVQYRDHTPVAPKLI